jgi:hypothetical protein
LVIAVISFGFLRVLTQDLKVYIERIRSVMKKSELLELITVATWACDAFDQADTGAAITSQGSRARIARRAIEDLKRELIKAGIKPTLPPGFYDLEWHRYMPKGKET